jgi:catechol 2,3-dioxygenase-like lactoylglutathione lyase family enzyme
MAAAFFGSHKVMAFVATRDPAAKSFYKDTLALRLLSEDGFALVFDANGTMLQVTTVHEVAPAKYTVLGWEVVDIAAVAAVAQDLESAGVKLEQYGLKDQDERGIWTAPGGATVAWFKDPDGNTLRITQF